MLGMLRQDLQVAISLGYIVTLKPTWATNPVWKNPILSPLPGFLKDIIQAGLQLMIFLPVSSSLLTVRCYHSQHIFFFKVLGFVSMPCVNSLRGQKCDLDYLELQLLTISCDLLFKLLGHFPAYFFSFKYYVQQYWLSSVHLDIFEIFYHLQTSVSFYQSRSVLNRLFLLQTLLQVCFCMCTFLLT